MAGYQFKPQELWTMEQVNRLRAAQAWLISSERWVTKYGASFGMTGNQIQNTIGWLQSFSGTGQEAVDRTMALSKALDRGALSFSNVGEAVGRATMKVAFWMVATTAVLGAMRKIRESYQQWKDLELALERIGITTSTVGKSLYTFFESAADVAIRMGMPIDQTLKGMDLALRATASIATQADETITAEKMLENQAKRTATAQLLLRDAAILGNVAGMQFSQAIDILVGSLKQTGMELSSGITLLDKWVAVSKAAQVSINDLSQGFAIMASAAESAGVSVDQVNGIIAALSETVTLGPVEVGNAVRSLMSTLYNETSIATLRKYGVAVKDAAGEFRSFWEIMSEVSALASKGILTNTQILEISRAIGGGARRYAQAAALIQNWRKSVEMANVSAQAQGDALEANERIVNTLTNAYDQFAAAQAKTAFAFGEMSGAISDLTQIFQFLAKTTAWMSKMPEDLAKTVKIVAELTAAFLTLKIVGSALTKLGIAQSLGNIIGLAGFTGGIKALAGRGLQPIAARTFIPESFLTGSAKSVAWNKAVEAGQNLRATQNIPAFMGFPSYKTGQMTAYTSGTVTGLTGGTLAKQAWGQVGQTIAGAMHKPLGLTGSMMGFTIGGLIVREITGSNWAGLGGAIGGAIGAQWGIAGMAAGSLIGGLIAQLIEDAATPFETKVERGLSKFIENLPPALGSAVSAVKEQLDFTTLMASPLEEIIQKQADVFEEGLTKYDNVLDKQERFYEFATKGSGITGPAAPFLRLWAKLRTAPQIETTKQGIDLIKRAQEESARLAKEAESYSTVYDKIAEGTQGVIDRLHLQEVAEARIEAIKQRSLDLTYEELETLIGIEQAAPLAYAKVQATLDALSTIYEGKPEKDIFGNIKEQFLALYPTFEDFAALKPEAYAPLTDLMSTIAGIEQQRSDNQKDITSGAGLLLEELGGQEISLENVNKQLEYWKKTQNSLLIGSGKLTDQMIESLGLKGLDFDKQQSLAQQKVAKIIELLSKVGEAIGENTSLSLEWNSAVGLLNAALEKSQTYMEPGRMVTLDVGLDLSKVKSLLIKYTEMLKPAERFESKPETFYAFLKDEFGAITGLYDVFNTYPEVWAAMLGELQGIEKNTAARLEAEYNIPSWYAVPTRYWAMKTTGTHEFGPAQERLWHLWLEFASQQGDALKDSNYALNGDTAAINANTDATNQHASAATDAAQKIVDAANRVSNIDWEINLPAAAQGVTPAWDWKQTGTTTRESYIKTLQDSLLASEFEKLNTESMTTNELKTAVDNLYLSANKATQSVVTLSDAILGTFANIAKMFTSGIGGAPTVGMNLWDIWSKYLSSKQYGGVIPRTGPYFLHKYEVVTPAVDFRKTNDLLSGSYQVLLVSQNYLSSINLGITGLREEIRVLREQMIVSKVTDTGYTEFRRVTNAGYTSVNSLGTRRV